MKKYKTIAEIKAANHDNDGHFFDRSAMKFFNSKIESGPIKGAYFITSEKYRIGDTKKYSVRYATEKGSIEEAGKFQKFHTKEDARDFIRTLPTEFITALEIARNEINGKTEKGLFVKYCLTKDTHIGKAARYICENWEMLGYSWLNHLATDFVKTKSLNTHTEKDTEQTEVIFLIHPVNGELMAYFPKEEYGFNGYRNDLKTCYAHIGQHSACAPEYAKECRPAKPEEYKELQTELEGMGYNLIVSNF